MILYDMQNVVRRLHETGQSVGDFLRDVNRNPIGKILVWDGENALTTRRSIFPNYKKKPQPKTIDEIYAIFDLMREIIGFTQATQIRTPGYEADDVIATIVARYPDTNFLIQSNDADFCQLLQLPNVQVARPAFKIEPKWVRLYKATVGDPSDKVPGIKGFGEASFEQANLDELQRAIVEHGYVPTLESSGLREHIHQHLFKDGEIEAIRIYWKVVGFLEVPEIVTIPSTPDFRRFSELMDEFKL